MVHTLEKFRRGLRRLTRCVKTRHDFATAPARHPLPVVEFGATSALGTAMRAIDLILYLVLLMPSAQAGAQGVRVDFSPTRCPQQTPAAEVAPRTFAAIPPVRIGLALGSGSMHGIAHIGVIQELEAKGVDARVVAGTSIGALVGALWASGLSGREIERLHRLEDWEDAGRFVVSRRGIFSNVELRKRLGKIFGSRPIESWPRRFGAVATDLDNGERVLLSSGDGALAVQASTAIPAIYMPVTIAGKRLADGALVEPVPVEASRQLGAEFVIAVDVAYRPYEGEASSITQIVFRAMHILINRLAFEQEGRADITIRADLHRVFMNCGRDSLIAAGRDAVRSAWPQIAQRLNRQAPSR